MAAPGATTESLYIVCGHHGPAPRVLREIPGVALPDGTVVSAGLGAKVIVEEDIVGADAAVPTLRALSRRPAPRAEP